MVIGSNVCISVPHLRLQQRRQHRIESPALRQLLGPLPFQRKSMKMLEKDRVFNQNMCKFVRRFVRPALRLAMPCRFSQRDDEVARDIKEHAPHAGHDLVTENRVVIAAQQMAQDRYGMRSTATRSGQLPGQFFGQRLFRARGSAIRCGVGHACHI